MSVCIFRGCRQNPVPRALGREPDPVTAAQASGSPASPRGSSVGGTRRSLKSTLRRSTFKFTAPSAGQFRLSTTTNQLYPSAILNILPAPYSTSTSATPPAVIGMKVLSACGASASCSLTDASTASSSLIVNASASGQQFIVALESNASSGFYTVNVQSLSTSVPRLR